MSKGPFLLIDIGNSRIKWALKSINNIEISSGLFSYQDILYNNNLRSTYNKYSKIESCVYIIDKNIGWKNLPIPGSAWISNVCGNLAKIFINKLIDKNWPCLPRKIICSLRYQCGVINNYIKPKYLGSDRWASLIGAKSCFPNENLVIVSFGTATTIEMLKKNGKFVGGLIIPGYSLMIKSLIYNIKKFSNIKHCDQKNLMKINRESKKKYANNTKESIYIGCSIAQAALVEKIFFDMQTKWKSIVRLVISGGASNSIINFLNVPYNKNDFLVLTGLGLIASKNT